MHFYSHIHKEDLNWF